MPKSSTKAKSPQHDTPVQDTQAPEQTPIDLAIDTLAGDVRDSLLEKFRGMKKGWTDLSEWEQRDIINTCQTASRKVVRQSVILLAERDFPSIPTTVGKWTVNDGAIALSLTAPGSVEFITTLAESGKAATLVLVDASAYFGERKPALADPDEPTLPLTAQAPTDGLSGEDALAGFEATKYKAPQPQAAEGEAPASEEAGDSVDRYRQELAGRRGKKHAARKDGTEEAPAGVVTPSNDISEAAVA